MEKRTAEEVKTKNEAIETTETGKEMSGKDIYLRLLFGI